MIAFIEETDIRILVFFPPVIGLVVLFLGFLMMNVLTDGKPPRSVIFILLGLLSFLLCFSGYAEIHKREMPGPLGGIYRGSIAIISGVFTIILFGLLGATALIYGFATLIR
jgi:hypothetical protein